MASIWQQGLRPSSGIRLICLKEVKLLAWRRAALFCCKPVLDSWEEHVKLSPFHPEVGSGLLQLPAGLHAAYLSHTGLGLFLRNPG